MSKESNSRKDALLGQPHGTAANKLRKAIIFMLAGKVDTYTIDGRLACMRCEQPIESVDDMSIEHKTAWQSAPDPRAAFFDLENIAFSHLSCNCSVSEASVTHCPQGHPYDSVHTMTRARPDGRRRECRTCHNSRRRRT